MEQAEESLEWKRLFEESIKKVTSKISYIIHRHRKRIITKVTVELVQWKNENTCDPCALASMFCQYFFDSWTIVSCEIPVKEGKKFLSAYDCCRITDMLKLECYWSPKAFSYFSFYILYTHTHTPVWVWIYIYIYTHTYIYTYLRISWGPPKQKYCIYHHMKSKHKSFLNYRLLK